MVREVFPPESTELLAFGAQLVALFLLVAEHLLTLLGGLGVEHLRTGPCVGLEAVGLDLGLGLEPLGLGARLADDLVGLDLCVVDELVRVAGRSEEHTSELQSLMRNSYAVFCLKQKKIKTTKTITQ